MSDPRRVSREGVQILAEFLLLSELADQLDRDGHAEMAEHLHEEAQSIFVRLLPPVPRP